MTNTNIQKLDMKTEDKTTTNKEQIAKLFPTVMSEGNIDFDLLKQMLSDEVVDGDDERYRLDWVGKKASLLKANTAIDKTLRPCKEDSVDFENTQNLYIEGDNFEVLKLIQESYLNKIKMIYIDPPYNRGVDYIYSDKFTKSKEEYEDTLCLKDEDENRLYKNTDNNGRFHSDWLSMMYERLLVSRDLLKDDGFIFISIDDNEITNLKKICDEVFGEKNCINKFVWRKNSSGKTVSKQFPINIDYILMYSKSTNYKLNTVFKPLSDATIKSYSKNDNDGRGKYCTVSLQKTKSPGPETTYDYIDNNNKLWVCPAKGWRMIKDKVKDLENGNRLYFSGETLREKCYWNERENIGKVADTLWDDLDENNIGTGEVKKLLKTDIFDNPKPTNLLLRCLNIATNTDDIILDFFSGSATTAHAVMKLNSENDGNRKHIMVQLPETTDEKSEAYKAGYKTIPEIGKERIRRAGKKILEDNEASKEPKDLSKLDIGFRVLKIDSSNMKDVYYHPNELSQSLYKEEDSEQNIKDDRDDMDLLFQIMLDLGVELSLKITSKVIDGTTIYILENNELVACMSDDISVDVIEEIKKIAPYQVVLKDSCFTEDKDKINAVESLSKTSTVSVI